MHMHIFYYQTLQNNKQIFLVGEVVETIDGDNDESSEGYELEAEDGKTVLFTVGTKETCLLGVIVCFNEGTLDEDTMVTLWDGDELIVLDEFDGFDVLVVIDELDEVVGLLDAIKVGIILEPVKVIGIFDSGIAVAILLGLILGVVELLVGTFDSSAKRWFSRTSFSFESNRRYYICVFDSGYQGC